MKKFYCNGKKGYCKNPSSGVCGLCKFYNAEGGKEVETRNTNYDRIRNMGASAIEKQIPKKPNIHGVREDREVNTISYTCPMCHEHIWVTEKYCKHCGQALDWSDTK